MSKEGTSDLVTILAAELKELRRLRKSDKCSIQDDQGTTGSVDNVVNLVHSDPGKLIQEFISFQNSKSHWILDSGASRHVTGMSSEFTSYTPYSYTRKETIQTADGTSQLINGVGTVHCTPSITLALVLYVPSS